MDERLANLTAALAGRYDIVREIGRGGMATVYLARDRRHGRDVALKAYHPDLAAASASGTDRFLREIEVAARLSHPNVLSLHDSGEVDGLPWYVMPYVDGESLADRIEREGQLSIAEAIRIARLVAGGLQHAHDQGVVHRDIKPDNIMLSGQSVMLADFGIAHALDTMNSSRLTATGLSVGTPAYMSPEQIAGKGRIDGRADIYSLGCVLYHMLIGEPPFGGASMQAILSRHMAEPVPQLRVVRASVPRAVEAVVHRALAKAPIDRFQSASEFADALAPQHLGDDSLAAILRPGRRRRRWAVSSAAAVTVAALVLWLQPWTLTRRQASASLDPHLIAVAPFGLSEVQDSAMRVVGSRVADLVVQRLPGDGGPRAVPILENVGPRARDRFAAASRMGAGLLLQGTVASLGNRVTLAASIRDSRTDSLLVKVEGINGTADSLPALLDQLTSQLLIGKLPTSPEVKSALATLPLATLRDYLAGKREFALGHVDQSIARFEGVLAVDSTCYPAALQLASAWVLKLDAGHSRPVLRLARTQLARMDASDTIQLNSLQLWPDADTTARLGASARLRQLDIAANKSTDPVRWYLLAERLFHDGPLLGISDMRRRAAESFAQVLELEPEFLPAIGHSIDLAATRGDTALVRTLAPRYFALDSVGDLSDYYQWRVAVSLDDSVSLARIRGRMDRLAPASLERIVDATQLDGVAVTDGVRAANALWAQSGAGGQARWAYVKQRELALNRGRPDEAREILEKWRRAGLDFRVRDGLAEVVNALFWGADTTAAAQWVRDIAPLATRQRPAPSNAITTDANFAACGVSLWRVLRGTGTINPNVVPILSARSDAWRHDVDMSLCRATVEAQVTARNRDPDAIRHLRFLDSLVTAAPPALTWILTAANITASDRWQAHGDAARALAAIRRRIYITDIYERRVLVGLSTMLRDEGRLAVETGDTTGAITAYRHYLALHQDAEPGARAEVDSVRQALANLGRP